MIFQNFVQNLIPWFFSSGIRIGGILIVAFLISRVAQNFIERVVKKSIKKINHGAEKKREETLISIFSSVLRVVIWLQVLLFILPEFGINAGALLAGAGIVGLAFGMGAREIIGDFLSGLFIILEDQYRVGDEVNIAGVEGKVQEITLRRTIIEDKQGATHSVPNGQIKVTTNKSR